MKQKSKHPKTRKTKARKTAKKISKKTVKKTIKKAAPRKVSRKKTPAVPKESIISARKPTDIQLLEQFFGGQTKMRLWKIFALNSAREFSLKNLVKLTKSKSDVLIPDLRELMRKGVVKATRKHILVQGDRKEKRIIYSLANDFPLLPEITQLILTAIPRSSDKVMGQLQSLQRLKLVLLSGFFTSKLGVGAPLSSVTQSTLDMLLVFDKMPNNIPEVIGELEHQLGRELRYATLDQDDFKYRHSIGDKLVRDVLDFEHIVVMDKMGFFK